jgi:hypothetical protein
MIQPGLVGQERSRSRLERLRLRSRCVTPRRRCSRSSTGPRDGRDLSAPLREPSYTARGRHRLTGRKRRGRWWSAAKASSPRTSMYEAGSDEPLVEGPAEGLTVEEDGWRRRISSRATGSPIVASLTSSMYAARSGVSRARSIGPMRRGTRSQAARRSAPAASTATPSGWPRGSRRWGTRAIEMVSS